MIVTLTHSPKENGRKAMISPEERAELVMRLKLALDDPHNAAGGSTPNYPCVWYITTPDLFCRNASCVGFYRDRAIIITGDRAWIPEAHLVFASHEDAIVESADRQKRRLEELHAEYLATCRTAHSFIADAQKAKKAEREKVEKETATKKKTDS